jgi:hypothetical protein
MAGRKQEKPATKVLRQSLGAPGEACPDPEIWAAYFDHSLDREETAHWELHLSQCSICRERLAAIDRASEPAPAQTARLPQSSWRWDWRWLAPAAAALIVAAIWIARRPSTKPAPEQHPLLASSVPQTRLRDAATPEYGRNQSAPAPPAGPQQKTAQQAPGRFGGIEKLSPENQQPPVHQHRSDLGPLSRNEVDDLGKKNTGLSSPLARGHGTDIDTPVGSEPEPSNASAAAAPAAGKAAGLGSSAQTVAVQGEVNSIGPQSGAMEMKSNQPPALARMSNERLPSSAPAQSRALALQAVEQRSSIRVIRTPDPKVLWRIAEGGFVERSTDGGTSWKGELPAVSAQLTAGFAPSADVCWVVGRSGAIFLSTNASDWKKIPPPASADFTAITAHDAFSAIVTAADGRKFTTTDGGIHWKPAP